MADTRTIYLLTPETVFCSDPNVNNGMVYLDMSEFDNLNPTRGTIVAGMSGAVSSYEPYDASIVLTFDSREARAAWIQENGDRVYQIAVANTLNQARVYNKKCAITSFEFLENSYINGIQTKITLKLFGKWQSSLSKLELNTGVYTGGTKEYTVGTSSPFAYVYDANLAYGSTVYTSAINLDGEQGFVTVAPAGAGLTLTLTSDYNGKIFQIESKYADLITGLSSDFVAYPFTATDNLTIFSMLDGGTVMTYGWNVELDELPYLYDMFNHVNDFPIRVGAINQSSNSVPIAVYAYTTQDFI